MTLSFSTQINGKPNYFIEKIWKGLIEKGVSTISEYQNTRFEFNETFNHDWDDKPALSPKLHTIREDKHDRWTAGNNIHPVINNRTPNRFQFTPVVKCVSVQEIIIEQKIDKLRHWRPRRIFIDGELMNSDKYLQLAVNDGFAGVDDFFNYFKKDFTGKIIHWTDLKY